MGARKPPFFVDQFLLTAARAVEDNEKKDNDDNPEELFVFKNIAEASHDRIPFYVPL